MGGNSASDPAEVVRRYLQLTHAHRHDDAVELLAETSVNHGRSVGRAQVAAIFSSLEEAFPDARREIEFLIAQGDLVAARVLASGTHLGAPSVPQVYGGVLAGAAPTGRSFSIAEHHFFRVVDGQIVEHWAVRDDLTMARQLGLLP